MLYALLQVFACSLSDCCSIYWMRSTENNKFNTHNKLTCVQGGALSFWFLMHFWFILQLVGQFIARAVNDQILSKSYIDGYKGRVDCEYVRYVNIYLSRSAIWWSVKVMTVPNGWIAFFFLIICKAYCLKLRCVIFT